MRAMGKACIGSLQRRRKAQLLAAAKEPLRPALEFGFRLNFERVAKTANRHDTLDATWI